MTEELTLEEKATLLAISDAKNKNDYDQEFYKAMCQTVPPRIDEVDDQVRRAIRQFTLELRRAIGRFTLENEDISACTFTFGFIHGYLVGRKLGRDIQRK